MALDCAIKGGRVYDGSGAAPYLADIGIAGERIETIGKLSDVEAEQIIDAADKLVTPGFIDAHSHSDVNLLVNPLAESKLRQGITTEIIGNCGDSPFPLKGELKKRTLKYLKEMGVKLEWAGAREYFKLLQDQGVAVNVVTMVGAGNLRAAVIGYDDTRATKDQIEAMQIELEKAFEAGAMGLSTGLIYAPGCFATTEEIIALARLAAKYGGYYTTHMRSEGDGLLEAVDEALRIGKEAEIGVQIAHLKASGRKNWGKARLAIEKIDQANAAGQDVWFDRYPYIASANALSAVLPHWVLAGGIEQAKERLQDSQVWPRISKETEAAMEGAKGWNSILLSFAGAEQFTKYEGQRIDEIARQIGESPGETFRKILLDSDFAAAVCTFSMDEDEMDEIYQHPRCLVCTDSSAWAASGPLSRGKPHPRSFGSFPRFLRRYVKEKKTFTLEEAITRTSGKTAQRFGLRHRGLIKEGYFADINVIDWDNFSDHADYGQPHQYASGILATLVNGQLVFYQGNYTGHLPGKILSIS